MYSKKNLHQWSLVDALHLLRNVLKGSTSNTIIVKKASIVGVTRADFDLRMSMLSSSIAQQISVPRILLN